MSSKQPPTKRKKKPSKSLLVRLSESCNSHKKNCHDNDGNEIHNQNESGSSSEQCSSDMKALKKIIPIIESACRCQHGRGHGQDNQHQSNSRQMDGIKRAKDIVNPKEVMHLCFFYISVVECAYCPHAMSLLFDNGRDGVEILPRVHQLFRHLASEVMVQDTVKSLRRRKRSSNLKDADAEQTPIVADHISRTCAVLLNSIPDQSLQVGILQDLIQILQDLATIASIGVLGDPTVNGEDIELLLFSGMIGEEFNSTEGGLVDEYGVELGTLDRLLLLQSSIFQILIQLFAMQNSQQSDLGFEVSEMRYTFQIDGEHRGLLLKSIRQALEASSDLESKSSCILSMRSKNMASGLLLLLIPEYQVHPDFQTVGMWQLMDIITSAVRAHFHYAGSFTEGGHLKDNGVRRLVDLISFQLKSFLEIIFLHQPLLCNPIERIKFDLVAKYMQRLCDCIPYIIKARESEIDIEGLSKTLLSVIEYVLARSTIQLSQEGTKTSDDPVRMFVLLLNHIKMNSICQAFVTLLSIPTYFTLTTSIITQLCNHCNEEVIERVCEIALNGRVHGNKRRRLEEVSSFSTSTAKIDESSRAERIDVKDSTSFTLPLVAYLVSVLDGPKVSASASDGKECEFYIDGVRTLANSDGVPLVFNAIFLFESFLNQGRKSIISLEVLERLYDIAFKATQILASFPMKKCDASAHCGAHDQIDLFVGSMSRLFYNDFADKNVLHDELFSVREKLLAVIVDLVPNIWSCFEYTAENKVTQEGIHLAKFEDYLICIPISQVKRIRRLISGSKHENAPCHPYMKESLGGSTDWNNDKFDYYAVKNANKTSQEGPLFLMKMEETFTVRQWTILTVKTFGCVMGDESNLFQTSLQSRNISDATKLSFFSILLDSLIPFAFVDPKLNLSYSRVLFDGYQEDGGSLKKFFAPLLLSKEISTNHAVRTIFKCLSRVMVHCFQMRCADIDSIQSNLRSESEEKSKIYRPTMSRIIFECSKNSLFVFEGIQLRRQHPQFSSKFGMQIIKTVQELMLDHKMLYDVGLRKEFWEFLIIFSMSCPSNCLVNLASICIQNNIGNVRVDTTTFDGISEQEGAQNKNETNRPTNLLEWLFDSPFTEKDEWLRTMYATQLGTIIFDQKMKLLRVMLKYGVNNESDDFATCGKLVAMLFEEIDEKLHNYCGVTQSELSLSMKTTQSIGTYTSHHSIDPELLTLTCSRQISAIHFISSLCKNSNSAGQCKSMVLEKGIMRLVRMWVTSSINQYGEFQIHDGKYCSHVALEAFQQLLILRDKEFFSPKSISSYNEALIPGLISEVVSRSFYAQKTMPNGEDQSSEFSLLIQFISSFLMDASPAVASSITIDGQERIEGVLASFDKALPATIAGLVLEQDYDSICACTRFRSYLLSELKRFGRKVETGYKMEERIVGKSKMKKRLPHRPRSLSGGDLKRQTAKLCVMADSSLDILGQILKSLLLDSNKASLVFFLQTVVRSEVSFGQLLKSSEFTILDALLWELGKCEGDLLIGNDFADASWREIYKDCSAYHALRRAVLFLQRDKDQETKEHDHVSTPTFSFDAQDLDNSSSSVRTGELIEHWVRKFFMRLLVNVTTKWKRGRIDTKISSMKSLRVLLRFLNPKDAEQYATAIFGIIDGSMHLDMGDFDRKISILQSLAVKNLSHFTRILLSHEIKVVGENLCNIIVSLFPLFRGLDHDEAFYRDDSIMNVALEDGVEIFELLVDGKIGKTLTSYFHNIAFLPKHSKLDNFRQKLKNHGVNFDNLLLLSTQLSSGTSGHESIASSSSVGTEEEDAYAIQRNKLQTALRNRLQSLENLINHENDNVRKVCLDQIIELVRNHRYLFHSVLRVEDASLRFLTVRSEQKLKHDGSRGIDTFVKGLLKRFVSEANPELRLLLASVLGEIGAVSPTDIDGDSSVESKESDGGLTWLVEKGAPWKSNSVRIHYELQLVTNYFITALKAAPSPTDQHKIAFAIQEVLKQLDAHATESNPGDNSITDTSREKKMNPWLKGQLDQAGVYNIIEPYWTSLYKQNEASKTKSPPFFETSTSYYLWLAEWGRFMVERSNFSKRSCYSKLFFACRSAIRSEAGLGILEFILPMLVLDSLCFGEELDRSSTLHELRSVLVCPENSRIEKLELKRSVDIVFRVIHILRYWAENELEERYKATRPSVTSAAARKGSPYDASAVWSPDDSLSAIEVLLNFITFDMCADAAARVGMHAQSLRFIEMHSRKLEAAWVFDSANIEDSKKHTAIHLNSIKGSLRPTHVHSMDIGKAHRLFGLLDDRDSMTAIAHCREDLNVFDQLQEKQSYNDWDGVLRLCERAHQIQTTRKESGRFDLEKFQTKALLELGHFDTVLNQIGGIVSGDRMSDKELTHLEDDLIAHAVNASWRLGRWDSLGRLVNVLDLKSDTTRSSRTLELDKQYDFNLGKALFSLHSNDFDGCSEALEEARRSIIPSLSVVAGEDYMRAYPYLTKLQCLREVQDVFRSDQDRTLSLIEKSFQSSDHHNLSTPMEIITVRLALSKIKSDLRREGTLWLSSGRKARKECLFHLAENSLSHADALYQRLQLSNNIDISTKSSMTSDVNANEVRLQMAKMKHNQGQSAEALRMIEVGDFDRLLHTDNRDESLTKLRVELERDGRLAPFTRNALQATEILIESGLLQSGSEAIERYKLLNQISPDWERAHYKYAKYLDSVVESRISVVAARTDGGSADDETARARIIKREKSCHKYILEAIKEYGEASRLSQKHVFQALPRLLTLWFDFTAIEGDDDLGAIQEDVNQFMVTCIKSIPPVAYYSVLPQLISRIGHQDEDTATIVAAILKRQLVKYPAQAMWQLSWLRQSVHDDRRSKGEEMFKVAQKSLRKNEDMKHHDLLGTSKNLILFLTNLAKYIPKRNDVKSFNIQQNSWKGKAELHDFLPPVQAALTVSQSAMGSFNSRDVFPREIPRMRAFSSAVQVMNSKAKPKKLTAFAIREGAKISDMSRRNTGKSQDCDIGEMHFLVKREAKGDLRKDARVQDLNTVINRLFSSTASPGAMAAKQHRRLKLRTFSVVCLSEECGILEWVPNTDSLRNVVTNSYNPHASHHSVRRRGKRITNFSDMNLRNCFINCQEQYVKHGNLTKAAKMFDELLLRDYPPVLYWWFVSSFQDPHKWFEARTRFALSAAAWAAVGHVIGLGDRHSENILLDTSCGECVHVDFDCIFDKGLTLPRPETIPFRLTSNMLDAFGPTGADGAFSGGLTSAMTTLRNNRDILLSVLEPFLRDPVIEWKRKSTQQSSSIETDKNFAPESIKAKRSIRVIDERLRGIYNLKNPNYKKIRRVDRETHDDDDEMASLIPLSVEGQVHKMIAEATSHENLVQVYVGWMPWL